MHLQGGVKLGSSEITLSTRVVRTL
jgi:hypothetical protein